MQGYGQAKDRRQPDPTNANMTTPKTKIIEPAKVTTSNVQVAAPSSQQADMKHNMELREPQDPSPALRAAQKSASEVQARDIPPGRSRSDGRERHSPVIEGPRTMSWYDRIGWRDTSQQVIHRRAHTDISKIEDEIDDMRDLNKRLRDENEQLKVKIGQLRDENKRVRIDAIEFNTSLKTCKKDNRQMENKINDLEQEIRIFQQKAFEGMKDGKWTPQQDSSIRESLDKLQQDIKRWAKDHAVKSIDHLKGLPATERGAFIEAISHIARTVDNKDLHPRLLEHGMEGRVMPLLLTGLLSHQIYSKIVDDPFYSLDTEETMQPGGQQQSSGLILNGIYKEVCEIDEKGAHLWRSQLIRLFNSGAKMANTDKQAMALVRVQERISRRCTALAIQFRTGPARHLLKDASEQQQVKLVSIFQQAGEIAGRLWTQRTYIRCLYFCDFSQETFRAGSKIMEAHPSHLQDDEHDRRLDNLPVMMIVRPTVLAYGDDDGERFDQCRVWGKAIVHLGNI